MTASAPNFFINDIIAQSIVHLNNYRSMAPVSFEKEGRGIRETRPDVSKKQSLYF